MGPGLVLGQVARFRAQGLSSVPQQLGSGPAVLFWGQGLGLWVKGLAPRAKFWGHGAQFGAQRLINGKGLGLGPRGLVQGP